MFKNFISRITSLWGKNPKRNSGFAEYKDLINDLKQLLGFEINSPEYFIKALTHRSYIDIEPNLNKTNERLEYLGDAVLDLIVSEYLFKRFLDEDEGFLTKVRSHMVDKVALARAAEAINLEKYLLYNRKFIRGSEGGLKTILADAMEALIGAIYLDSGLENCRGFVLLNLVEPLIDKGIMFEDKNYKGRLLEYTHSQKFENPIYSLVKEEGPQHDKIFSVDVIIDGEVVGHGKGKSKKSAEQQAASRALIHLAVD